MKKTYDLFIESYGKERLSEPYIIEYWYAVSGSVQCGGLSVSLGADVSRHYCKDRDVIVEGEILNGKAIEAYIKWNFSSKRSIAKCFPLSESGIKDACAWLDEKRQEFAQRILDGDEY